MDVNNEENMWICCAITVTSQWMTNLSAVKNKVRNSSPLHSFGG